MISIPFDHHLSMNTNDIHQSHPFPLIHVDLNRDPNPSPDYSFPIHHHQDHYPHGANFVDELIIARGGPHDQPSSVMILGDRRIGDCENENGHDLSRDHHHHREYCSVKWMSSKMRIRKKMTTGSGVRKPSAAQKIETDLKHKAVPPTILEKDDSSNNGNRSSTSGGIEINNNNPIIIRVCSDCNTTKTPLWRSGPRGPKSLCNACGIRQRKARRAMALAAAAANGDPPPYPIPNPALKAAKKKKKKKKRSLLSENKDDDDDESDPQPKKKGKRKGNKIVLHPPADPRDICFEELRLRLSDRISGFQGVFPQDEKEAAILLMALSYGLVQS